jgi:hypothetical protein
MTWTLARMAGHSPEIPKMPRRSDSAEVIEGEKEIWCARRDSNSRPIAPEAITLVTCALLALLN